MMKKNDRAKRNNSAVSLIIGTILLVAVTISISATVYIYVNGAVSQQPEKLTVIFDVDYDQSKGTLHIQHMAGDIISDAIKAEQTDQNPQQNWWNTNWKQRSPITIQNPGNTLTNYQIKLNLPYDSDMQNDFDDLRFVESDHSTLLSHWTESKNPGNQATIWIKIPSLPSGATTIYAYYGNTQASSISNPSTTFDAYFNFNQDTIVSHDPEDQDVEDPTPMEIINPGTIRFYGNTWKGILKNINVVSGTQVVDFDFKSTGVNLPEINGVGFETNNDLNPTADDDHFYMIYGDNDEGHTTPGIQYWGINDHYGYSGNGDWQSYSLILDDFSGTFDRIIINNDEDDIDDAEVYYRNIRLRKYASAEPTAAIDYFSEETTDVEDQDFLFDSLAIAIDGEQKTITSMQMSSGGTNMYGGDILTIRYDETDKPQRGDTITIRYVPSNQLLKIQKI